MKVNLAAAVLAGCVAASSTDECTTDLGEARLAVHLYFCKDWARKRVLAGLPVLAKRPNAENVAELWLKTILNFLGITKAQLASRMVMLAADGASALQGEFTGAIKRFIDTAALFAEKMHCAAHRVELSAKSVAKDPVFQEAKTMLTTAYNYFNRSNVRRMALLECHAAVGLHRTKLKLLPKKDGETRWISHYYPAQVMLELQPSVMRYTLHHIDNELSDLGLRATYIDLRGWMALAAFFPMLYQEQLLIKMLQLDDLYVLVRLMVQVLLCNLSSAACTTCM
jgi:hypothetical protein